MKILSRRYVIDNTPIYVDGNVKYLFKDLPHRFQMGNIIEINYWGGTDDFDDVLNMYQPHCVNKYPRLREGWVEILETNCLKNVVNLNQWLKWCRGDITVIMDLRVKVVFKNRLNPRYGFVSSYDLVNMLPKYNAAMKKWFYKNDRSNWDEVETTWRTQYENIIARRSRKSTTGMGR